MRAMCYFFIVWFFLAFLYITSFYPSISPYHLIQNLLFLLTASRYRNRTSEHVFLSGIYSPVHKGFWISRRSYLYASTRCRPQSWAFLFCLTIPSLLRGRTLCRGTSQRASPVASFSIWGLLAEARHRDRSGQKGPLRPHRSVAQGCNWCHLQCHRPGGPTLPRKGQVLYTSYIHVSHSLPSSHEMQAWLFIYIYKSYLYSFLQRI